jgi:Ca-activated chloride channel homolog
VTFATPLGLLALAAIPAIVAIHLFRRKFPERPVAGLFLWRFAPQNPDSGRRLDKLPMSPSLILECLAALALALILAGARLSSSTSGDHLIVLLDDSASMAAGAQGETARDRGVARVLAEIEKLGPRGLITLIRSGERPSVIAGPAAFTTEAEPALREWQPSRPHHSLAVGLRLAREFARDGGRILVISDGPPASATDRILDGEVWVSVGRSLANVAIVGAERAIPSEGRGTLSLTVRNSAEAPARRVLRVTAADKEVLTRELQVPPGTSSINLPLPAGLPALRASLSNDVLPRDDEAVLVEPRSHIVAIENNLKADRGRDALDKAINALSNVTRAESGHLAFSSSLDLAQPGTPGVWRVGFGRPPANLAAAGDPADFIGPFIMEKRHPLLLGVTLGGIVWTGAAPVSRAMHPVVSAGELGLLGVLNGGGSPEAAVLFNIDLERTNLIRSPDWPILISNLVEMRRRELPGPERWNYRIGEWVRVKLDRDPSAVLRLRWPGGERELPRSRLIEFAAPAPGGLVQILEADKALYELGVNFLDEIEADLRSRTTDESGQPRDAQSMQTERRAASDPLFWVLLVIAAVAMLGNWFVLGSRRVPA